MIRNDYTNETAHVANWLLCSGAIDPMALCDRACLLAQEEEAEIKDDEYDMEASIIERLEPLLESAFTDAILQAIPDSWGVDLGEIHLLGLSEADYRAMSPDSFALSLLAPALEKIDLRAVAWLVAEHVFKRARALTQHELN